MLIEIVIILVLIAAFIAEVVLTEVERFGWATALLLVCGACCYYFNLYDSALWVKAHVAETLIFVGIYLVAGVIWSFVKWFSYLLKYREQWHEAKDKDKECLPQLIKDHISKIEQRNAHKKDVALRDRYEYVPEVIPQTDEEWINYIKSNGYSYELSSVKFSKPLASDNKVKITAWMAFWPFSFLGTFINDPIRRLFNFIFSNFKKLYQKMSDSMFKDLETKDPV